MRTVSLRWRCQFFMDLIDPFTHIWAPLSLAQCLCSYPFGYGSWWRHQRETFSTLLALCEENPPVTGGFPSDRPVSFDVFFDLRLNKLLSKHSRRRWFETPSRSLWCHCNGKAKLYQATTDTTKCELCVHISWGVLWSGHTYTYIHGTNVFNLFHRFLYIKMLVFLSVRHDIYNLVAWGRSLLIYGVWV